MDRFFNSILNIILGVSLVLNAIGFFWFKYSDKEIKKLNAELKVKEAKIKLVEKRLVQNQAAIQKVQKLNIEKERAKNEAKQNVKHDRRDKSFTVLYSGSNNCPCHYDGTGWVFDKTKAVQNSGK